MGKRIAVLSIAWTGFVLVLAISVLSVCPAAQSTNAYIIGPSDVIAVVDFDQADLSGKYTVESDGTFNFPLIGRVKAGGLTLRQLETALKRALADGFFKNPQLSVSIDQYRSQQIYVVGEVRSPGMYTLNGPRTLIEAIAMAGSALPSASEEILVVRPKDGKPQGPPRSDAPGDDTPDVIRINLRAVQSGALADNIELQDGDTVFVPRADTIYVFGQVKAPGAYPIQPNTTVLQALSLAGGVTDRGSTSRIKIVRFVNGEKRELKVKLSDIVKPGDTIIVQERFF
jgi:polysaccharide export outer membrane protein